MSYEALEEIFQNVKSTTKSPIPFSKINWQEDEISLIPTNKD